MVANPKDRFSLDEAHMHLHACKVITCSFLVYEPDRFSRDEAHMHLHACKVITCSYPVYEPDRFSLDEAHMHLHACKVITCSYPVYEPDRFLVTRLICICMHARSLHAVIPYMSQTGFSWRGSYAFACMQGHYMQLSRIWARQVSLDEAHMHLHACKVITCSYPVYEPDRFLVTRLICICMHARSLHAVIPYMSQTGFLVTRLICICMHARSLHAVISYMSLITRKPVFGVFDHVRLKQVCSATEIS